MSDIWYKNPKILLENINNFIPNKRLSRVENINALARLAIYFFIFIIVFELESYWTVISIIIIFISYFLGYTEKENFSANFNKKPDNTCEDKKINNPYMNYLIGDLIKGEVNPSCINDQTKILLEKDNQDKTLDKSQVWDEFITNRNFYTMPNKDIINDRNSFALWCYNNEGECKILGTNCLRVRDPTYHKGRLTTVDNGIYV